MASGPEHYRKAEQLLADADSYEDDQAMELARDRRAEAQVRATLALAAATANQLGDRYVGDGDHITEWNAATSGLAWGGSRSAEGSCEGISLNGVHTQIFNCKQVSARHDLHLWRTATEWFTCRGEAA